MYKLFICCIAVLISSSLARPNQYDAAAETRSFSNDLKEDGSYQYQFDTTNGIAAQESGVGGYYASGSSAYYAPDGQLITLSYTADENGFHPSGDHLPTPPPIPAAILKALDYIRTHPNQENREGGSQLKQQQQPQYKRYQ
ncbi:Pupal cuticle protein Edg-78E [Lucilia cuprina]|uniref:Pupal cuticle protein Edg-78E n=1 Tax=Lucilia cuprina TaxID=7375 RepID=A0A0L0CJC2_LUCCU|nr:pupal cuticle protein Edg-78E-like [Lucilia cuprina]KAI8118269.1 Pupal cuticle protein Edg-78E [Lucilia cuprina]KNC32350.1 Pupal cuticle protein Edg-78E [Lucilia cuprina]